jgi:hypothetical protein
MSDTYCTTTTIANEPTEGWTLILTTEQTLQEEATNEFPTTTSADDGRGPPPTNKNRADDWTVPPAAPSPPVSTVDNHASLHCTACYNDYCNLHHQSKDNAYYPRRANGGHRRNHRPYECPYAHPFELAVVIRNRHLNPRKACADWYKGKRVYPHCRYLVNMDGHENQCGAALPPPT